MKYLVFVFGCLCILCGCFRENHKAMVLPVQTYIQDSAAATTFIIADTSDGFFAALRPIDKTIQMHGDTVLSKFPQYLAQDVTTLTLAERSVLTAAILDAKKKIEKFGPAFWPQPLHFLITKGNCYGATTWYTRENCIVVPLGLVRPGNQNQLTSTILHEIFHVWSRRNKSARTDLFGLMGFIEQPQPWVFEGDLGQRLLQNPDAVNLNWYIKGKHPRTKNTTYFVPLLTSRVMPYKPLGDSFFSHLTFNWHTCDISRGVVNKESFDLGVLPEIQNQIGDNTDYNIHPEELMADHFMMLVEGKRGSGTTRGLQLMEQTAAFLKKFK